MDGSAYSSASGKLLADLTHNYGPAIAADILDLVRFSNALSILLEAKRCASNTGNLDKTLPYRFP